MNRLTIRVGNRSFSVESTASADTGEFYLRLDDQHLEVKIPSTGAPLEAPTWLIIDGRPYEIELDPELRWITAGTGRHELEIKGAAAIPVRVSQGGSSVKAPIPGQITRIFVSPQQVVEPNQRLCVLEAMKMENEIRSAQAGVVTALPIAIGQIVRRGQLLAEIS